MKSLFIYDSQYGNTQKIAFAISCSLPSAKVLQVTEVKPLDLEKLDMLIVGSPTQGGRPTKAIGDFLSQLPAGKLKGVKVAAFDTRLLESKLNFGLKMLVKLIGYAAPKIARVLVDKGGKLIVPPQGFFVQNTKGPLINSELAKTFIPPTFLSFPPS